MSTWRVRFVISPYQGVMRRPAKYTSTHKPNRGAAKPEMEIVADDFEAAHSRARDILAGIMLDERVWKAGITEISESAS